MAGVCIRGWRVGAVGEREERWAVRAEAVAWDVADGHGGRRGRGRGDDQSGAPAGAPVLCRLSVDASRAGEWL